MSTLTLTNLPPKISKSIQRTKYNIKEIGESPPWGSADLNAAPSAAMEPLLAFKDLYYENGEDEEDNVSVVDAMEGEEGEEGDDDDEYSVIDAAEDEMTKIKLLLTEREMKKIMEKLSYEFVLSYILSDQIVTLGSGREDADKAHQTDFGRQDNTTLTLYKITLLIYKHSWELLINYINSLNRMLKVEEDEMEEEEEDLDPDQCKEIYKYIALLTHSLGVHPEIYTDFLKWTKADADEEVFTKCLPLGSPEDGDSISEFEHITTIWQLINFLKNKDDWTLHILMQNHNTQPGYERWDKAKKDFKIWLLNEEKKTFSSADTNINGKKDQFTKLNGSNGDNAHFLPQNINTFGRIAKDYGEEIPGLPQATNITQIQNFVLPQSRGVNQGKGGDEAFLESRRAGDQLLGLKILLEILLNNWTSGQSSENLKKFAVSNTTTTGRDVPYIREEMSAEILQNLLSGIVYIFLDMLIDNIIEKKLTGSGPNTVTTILTQQQHIWKYVKESNSTETDIILAQLRAVYKNQMRQEKQKILKRESIQSLQEAFDESISNISNISEISEKLDIRTLYGKDNKIADCVLKGLQLLYEVEKLYKEIDKEGEKVIDVLVKPQGIAMDELGIGDLKKSLTEDTERLEKLITDFRGNESLLKVDARHSLSESVPYELWTEQGTKAIASYKSSEVKAKTLKKIRGGFTNYRRREIFIIHMLKNTATIKTVLNILKKARGKDRVAGIEPEQASEIIKTWAATAKPAKAKAAKAKAAKAPPTDADDDALIGKLKQIRDNGLKELKRLELQITKIKKLHVEARLKRETADQFAYADVIAELQSQLAELESQLTELEAEMEDDESEDEEPYLEEMGPVGEKYDESDHEEDNVSVVDAMEGEEGEEDGFEPEEEEEEEEVKLGNITLCHKNLIESITSLDSDIKEIETALREQSGPQERAAAARVEPSITVSAKEQPLLFYNFIKKIQNFFQKLVDDNLNFTRKDWLDRSNLENFFEKQINNLVYGKYFRLLTPEQKEAVSMYFHNYRTSAELRREEQLERIAPERQKEAEERARAEAAMEDSIQLNKKYFNTLASEIAQASGNANFDSIKYNFKAITFQYLMLLAYVEVATMTMQKRTELAIEAEKIWNKYANSGKRKGERELPKLKRSRTSGGSRQQVGGGRNYKKLKKNTKKIKLNKKTKKIKQKDFKNNKKKTKKRKNTKTKKPTKNLTLKKRRPTKIRKPTKTRNPKKKPKKKQTKRRR